MRFPEPARAADASAAPVWARSKRQGNVSIVGLLVGLLAMFGALMIGVWIADKSLAKGGARVDGWVCAVIGKIPGVHCPKAAAEAAAPATAMAPAPAGAAQAAAEPAAAAEKVAEKAVDKAADKAPVAAAKAAATVKAAAKK